MEIGFAGGGSLLDFLIQQASGCLRPLNNMGPKEVYAELLKCSRKGNCLM